MNKFKETYQEHIRRLAMSRADGYMTVNVSAHIPVDDALESSITVTSRRETDEEESEMSEVFNQDNILIDKKITKTFKKSAGFVPQYTVNPHASFARVVTPQISSIPGGMLFTSTIERQFLSADMELEVDNNKKEKKVKEPVGHPFTSIFKHG